MQSQESQVDPVGPLADEFVARLRRGERPAISEYTEKYPALAERIRQVFPLMALMEQVAPESADWSIRDGEGPVEPREPSLTCSTEIGGYRILREIGRGGMGIVYEAEQVALGRHVALKVLPLDAAREGTRLERFRREARAAARLHHSHIVPVFEVGDEGDVCYYAMQYIAGQPLDEVVEELRTLRAPTALAAGTEVSTDRAVSESLRARQAATEFVVTQEEEKPVLAPTPACARPQAVSSSSILQTGAASFYRNVARVGIQVASALAYAHREGVVHRDIKPSNLLLDSDGQVWITDFGLAKTDANPLTGTGDFLGTLRYMPPERFRGWSDPRSDIYSLGLTLYELLALRPAFAETDPARLVQQISTIEPPRLSRFDHQVPRDLATIIGKAIDKEPTRRYQTADDLAADLQRFVEDRPIVARQSSTLERTWRWCKRNPAVATLLASLAVVLVLVAWQWRRAENNADSAHANAEKAKQKRAEAEENLKRERAARWQSLYETARALSSSRQPGQRLKGMEVVREAARLDASPKLRDVAIRMSGLTDIRLGQEWGGYPRGTNFVIFDKNLLRYARGNHQGVVSIGSVPDDQPLLSLPAPKGDVPELTVTFMRFSPDGRFLAVVYGHWSRVLHVWDLSQQESILQRPSCRFTIAFTNDSRQIVVGHENGSLGVFDLATSKLVRALGKAPSRGGLATVSPNGKWLAICSHHTGRVEIRDFATGAVRKLLSHPENSDAAWHPHDENLLATSGRNIYLWDLRNPGKPMSTLPGQVGPTTNIAFNHRGDILASKGFGGDSTMRLWDPWTGRQLVSIVGANSNSEMPIQFSPDDRRLAYAINGDNLGLFEIETAREFRSLQGHAKLGEGNYAWMDTHSRLPLLAAGTRYGANTGIRDGIHLWNLDTGRKLDFLPVGETRGLSFHPSGAVLFTGQQEGAFAWPFTAAPLTPLSHGERGNVWRLGPPHRFLEGPAGHISLNKNARRMSVVGARDVVMDLPEPPALPLPEPPAWVPGNLLRSLSDRLSRRVTLSQGGGLIVLSPDGRWAVGSSAHDASIPVWDAQTGKQIRSLSAAGWTSAEFSPDGRWLLVGIMNGYVLYEVGSLPPDSWRLRYQLPRNVGGDVHGAFAWSPDSRFFAVMLAGSVVRFVEPETGRELANLEPPDPDWAIPQRLRFSADGSMLIVSTDELRMIHVWDLRLIGARLAELGLPWDLPRFRRASSDVDAGRFRVEVHLGDFAGREQRK